MSIELLSPAGNIEKLYYAYAYGADAAYIGLKRFSLRVKADNFYADEYTKIIELKRRFPGKRLHCALNISFHNADIDQFISDIPYFKQYPIDAFIVQDLGLVPLLQRHFPDVELHLSTQASCVNREAVKVYKSLGFSRVVLGREAGIAEIAEIKAAVPEMELECFVHGAMCIAYSGRCLMSAYLNGRSGQGGLCSHTCRWDFDVLAQSGALALREHKRPDEYFPVFEGDNFTAVLSSKDLCMVDHLADLRDAGVDSFKIEGRMKSVYYVAMVTRAYRKALDVLEGKLTHEEARPFIDELYKASHREFSTGFYYNKAEADKTVCGASDSEYELAATIGAEFCAEDAQAVIARGAESLANFYAELNSLVPAARAVRDAHYAAHPEKVPAAVQERTSWRMYEYNALNKIDSNTELEFVSPDISSVVAAAGSYALIDPATGCTMSWVCNGHPCLIYTALPLHSGDLVRVKDPDFVPGTVRSTGR